MSGPDWIQTSDLQWLHQFREHFPVYSAPTPQMNKFRDIFRSIPLVSERLRLLKTFSRSPLSDSNRRHFALADWTSICLQ